MNATKERRLTSERVLADEEGFGGFRLEWSVENHWADVAAYEVMAAELDGTPLFNVDGWTCSHDVTPDVAKAKLYLKGFIKWDGCTELSQGKPHWCGAGAYAQHILLLQHIYRRAFELMGCEPEDVWPLTITKV